MTGRRVLLAATCTVLVAGCGATPPPAASVAPSAAAASSSSSPSPTPSPAPPGAAARALAALQASVADLGAVEVSGGTPGSLSGGRIRAASDLRTGDFRATVELGDGSGTLRMVRQSDLTWTTAPSSFWTTLGYTPDSARQVQDKWVVARANDVRPLVESLDPGIAVRALLELGPADVLSVATVRTGGLRGNRVLTFAQGGREQQVYLTSGSRPRLLRIETTAGGRRTALDFVAFPDRLRVTLPPPADVFVPQ